MQIIENDMGWETKISSGDHFFEKNGPGGPKFSVKKLVPRTKITGTKIPVTGFVQGLESWKSYGFAFYDFKGPEKFGNTAQYEKFIYRTLKYAYARCESVLI